MEITEDEGQRLADEFTAKLGGRPVKATYDLATLGAEAPIPGLLQPGYLAPIGAGA